MPIQFTTYPASNRVPGVYAELDPSRANTGSVNEKTLIIGQMLSTGTATAGVPVLVSSYAEARALFGAGSMLSLMIEQYRKSDQFATMHALPLADNGAGVAEVDTITVSGPATGAGTLNLYVAGKLVQAAVANGDSANAIATKLHAAINAAVDLPVTATVATNVVTLSARHKGVVAGEFDLRLNYAGSIAGENTPAGVALAFAQATAGSGDPVLDFSNLGDEPYSFICTPYSNGTEMAAVDALLSETTGRWSWMSDLYGHAFTARKGTVAQLVTYGQTQNSEHVTVLGLHNSPTPAYLIAADYTAVCAVSGRADPALPLQSVVLNIQAPPRANRFTLSERNTLYYSGVSCVRVNDADQVILDRSVTTNQKDNSGAPSNAYLDTETMVTLQHLLRDLRHHLSIVFPRKKLVADGTQITAGSNAVTPSTIRAEVIAWYRRKAADLLVQNMEAFTKECRAENAGNGRVNILLPLDLAQQLRIQTLLVQFQKS